MSNLTAKARRAAEWLKTNGVNVRTRRPITIPECDTRTHSLIWNVGDSLRSVRVTLLEMILFAEDRGWQDTEPDAGNMVDGVEWNTLMEVTYLGGDGYLLIEWDAAMLHYIWAFRVGKECDTTRARGTAPTREEARRQAVEAARGVG